MEERTKRLVLKIDDEEERTVIAQFATFGVTDHDGDVTEPGAFREQEVFMGAWNHNPYMLPPGLGKTYEEDDGAYFKGQFFDSVSGNEHYELIKAAGGQMEWSYRFFVEDGFIPVGDDHDYDDDVYFVIRQAKITHVAPVEAGAGIGTRTVDVKCVGCEAKSDPPAAPRIDYQELAKAVAPAIDYQELAKAVAPAIDYQELGKAVAAYLPKNECGGGCKGCSGKKGDNLGTLIRNLRDAKELSNEELAEAAGISVDTLGQILGGTLNCPKASRLEALAAKLGVKLSMLMEAAEQDGCGDFDDDAKADEPAAEKARPTDDPGDPDPDPDPDEGASLEKQYDALISGFPGLPDEVDPATAIYERWKSTVGA